MKNKEDITSNGKLFNKFLLMFQSKNKEGIKSKKQLLKGLPEEENTSKAVNEVIQYVTSHPDEASEILQTILNKDEISNDVFKEASIEMSKNKNVPNAAAAIGNAVENSDVSDSMISEIIRKGKLGIETRGRLIKQIDDKNVRRGYIIRELSKIYNRCDKYHSDEALMDAISSIRISSKVQKQDQDINKWIKKIISKRMASNFNKFGFAKVFVFSKYYTPEQMIGMQFAKDVMNEYDELSVKVVPIKEENVIDTMLDAVAMNIAKNYEETGRYIIPQISNLNKLTGGEINAFIHYISSRSKRELNSSEINGIKKQIYGKRRNAELDTAIFNKLIESGIIDSMEDLSEGDRNRAIKAIKGSLDNVILKREEKVEDDEKVR